MRFITFLVTFLCSSSVLLGQSAWQDVSIVDLPANWETINAYHAANLDLASFQQQLKAAPMQFSAAAKQRKVKLDLPMPNGQLQSFHIVESPVMMEGISARYPDIKSYKGVSVADASTSVRLSISPAGVKAVLHTPAGMARIKPILDGSATYISYLMKDVVTDDSVQELSCGYTPTHEEDVLRHLAELEMPVEQEKSGSGPLSLRTYRMAMSSTVAFSRNAGTSRAGVLATFNDVINILNSIFEREAAVTFVLIDRTDELIFLTAAEDPFTSNNEGRKLIEQAPLVFDGIIPPSLYDIGHVLTGNCTDVGGVASRGSLCTTAKARGISCRFPNMTILRMVVRNMAHEVGHQFSASHTMSACGDDENNQLSPETAFEVGSGSTIMSYAGGCGSDNIQNESDDYFHGYSLDEIIGYSRLDFGSTCGSSSNTGNDEPIVTLDYENDFYIPLKTPFVLSATATDPNGDALLYCWEQFNAGKVNTGNGFIDAAAFRSYPPTASPSRTFPRRPILLNGNSEPTEVLPTFSRDLTFRCTVRDNNPAGGATVWEELSFKATDAAGPFLVTYPTSPEDALEAGQQVAVTWDVANTNSNPVNCQRVNIRLSLDGGNTFPIYLVENARNDGSELVTIPDVTTTEARIQVEAADNIFFNVSRQNFPITAASSPSFALRPTPFYQQVCLPTVASIAVASEAIGGFSGEIMLSVANLPEGAVANFEPASISAGESTTLTIDMTASNANGITQFQVIGQSADASVSINQPIEFNLISTDFSTFSLTSPTNGTRGIVGITDFEWSGLENADSYDFELSSSPTFAADAIVYSASGLRGTRLTPEDVFLDEASLFYWRVRPVNQCGAAAYSIANVFQTLNVQCVPFAQTEAVSISGTGTPTVQSIININTSGTINDLNIANVTGSYQPVRTTEVSLISPAGTQAVLFFNVCGGTSGFDLGFDDEAPDEIQCPPTSGIVHQPIEPLSIFDGEDIQGEWKMQFRITQAGFGSGGSIDSWEMESCASIEPNAPLLIVNETFALPPNSRSQIWTTTLEAIDEDNSTDEIIYELLSVPAYGTLYVRDTPLELGDSFTQQDIDGYRLSFEHNGDEVDADGFSFLIRDTNAGWYGPEQFNIAIDADAMVGTNDPALAQQVQIYPNPARDRLAINMEAELAKTAQVRMFNLNGQQVAFRSTAAAGNLTLDTSAFAEGIYFLQIYVGDRFYTERVLIQGL